MCLLSCSYSQVNSTGRSVGRLCMSDASALLTAVLFTRAARSIPVFTTSHKMLTTKSAAPIGTVRKKLHPITYIKPSKWPISTPHTTQRWTSASFNVQSAQTAIADAIATEMNGATANRSDAKAATIGGLRRVDIVRVLPCRTVAINGSRPTGNHHPRRCPRVHLHRVVPGVPSRWIGLTTPSKGILPGHQGRTPPRPARCSRLRGRLARATTDFHREA